MKVFLKSSLLQLHPRAVFPKPAVFTDKCAVCHGHRWTVLRVALASRRCLRVASRVRASPCVRVPRPVLNSRSQSGPLVMRGRWVAFACVAVAIAADVRATELLGCLREIPRLNVMPRLRDCAVVGASDVLRIQPQASLIDSHASVWRINNAPTESFEQQVGARTDVRIMNAVTINVWDKYQRTVRGECSSIRDPCIDAAAQSLSPTLLRAHDFGLSFMRFSDPVRDRRGASSCAERI